MGYFMKRQILTILFLNLITLINAQSNFSDSTINLISIINKESKDIGGHGIDYFDNNKMLDNNKVAKDFAVIVNQAKIITKNYKFSFIKSGKYNIKIFEGINGITNPYRVIEIITVDSTRHKKIPIKQYNFLILSKDKPRIIEIEVDENGINTYKIDNREISCSRESAVEIDDDYDNSAFFEAKKIIDKYKKNNP